MVTATEDFVRAHPKHKGSIAFLITSDEEGPSVDGTKKVMETLASAARTHRLVHRRRALEREGSSATPSRSAVAARFSGRLTVHGVQGHVAYPQLAENPVHTFAPALAELTARVWDQGNEHFQPTTFQISNFNAGTGAPNVIPGELKARFNLRYSPVQTLDGLKDIVEGILSKHGVRYTLEWYISGEPFYTPPGALSERRDPRDPGGDRLHSPSSPPAAARPTGASSRRSARRSWSSAWSMPPSTRSTSACAWPTSTACTAST